MPSRVRMPVTNEVLSPPNKISSLPFFKEIIIMKYFWMTFKRQIMLSQQSADVPGPNKSFQQAKAQRLDESELGDDSAIFWQP